MNALIFAAGLGTRLYPLTADCPKALVEVGGKPMLQRVIESVAKAGATKIVINIHHFADRIENFLAENSNFGLEILTSREQPYPFETGGGIVKAWPLLTASDNEPIILHNADILTDVDLREMIARHKLSGADATLLCDYNRQSSRRFLIDNNGFIKGWTNISTGQIRPASLNPDNLHKTSFGGIHIVNTNFLKTIAKSHPEGVPFSITDFYIENCGNYRLQAYNIPQGSIWHDIGSPEKLNEAEKSLQTKSRQQHST